MTDQQLAERVAFTPCLDRDCDMGFYGHESGGVQGWVADRECDTCKGTGLRYPGLSVECGCRTLADAGRQTRYHRDTQRKCKGRGRIARSPEDPATFWFVMEAIRSRWPYGELSLTWDSSGMDWELNAPPKGVKDFITINQEIELGKEIPALYGILAQMEAKQQ